MKNQKIKVDGKIRNHRGELQEKSRPLPDLAI